jgi:hypothetical protein
VAVKNNLRITCRIPCEISHGRERSRATVVDVSERGLGVETSIRIGEGESVQIKLHPNRQTGAIEVRGIIWNERTQTKSAGRSANQVLGLMLSEAPDSYLAMVDKLAGNDHDSRGAPRPQRTPPSPSPATAKPKPRLKEPDREPIRIVEETASDSVLPRPKFPLPPQKQSEEESLPTFRTRVKQVDGPRTRVVEIRAVSENDVASRAQQMLDGEWEILEVRRLFGKHGVKDGATQN